MTNRFLSRVAEFSLEVDINLRGEFLNFVIIFEFLVTFVVVHMIIYMNKN